MLYELTKKNLREGRLSDKDFSMAAGYPVKTFSLSQFPHYQELQQNKHLSEPKQYERAVGILGGLHEAGLLTYTWNDAMEIAGQPSPNGNMKSIERIDAVSFDKRTLRRHFDLIAKDGFDLAHTSSDLWIVRKGAAQAQTCRVLPASIDEEFGFAQELTTQYSAAFFLARDQAPATYWAQRAYLAPSLLENYPQDGLGMLHSDLHEQRHLQQLTLPTGSVIPRYYRELDADMAANAALRRKGVGQETCAANLNARYIGFLFSSPAYAFAPTLEALENRKKPKNFHKTIMARNEIMVRLAAALTGDETKHQSSHIIQIYCATPLNKTNQQNAQAERAASLLNNFYDILDAKTQGNPAILYTTLKHLVDSRVFSNPFSEQVAVRIVQAAAYFNPDLINADQEPVRKRLANRMASPILIP